METGFMNRIIGLVLALVVGGLLVGGLLIPSIEAMTATEKTFENEGLFYMKEYTADESIPAAIWDSTTPNQIAIGDDEYSLTDQPTPIAWSVIFSEKWAIRFTIESNVAYCQYFGEGNGILVGASTTDANTLTATFNAGTVTITNGVDTETDTYSKVFIISGNDGKYVMKNSNESVYVLKDTDVFVTGRTVLPYQAPSILNIHFMGSIKDGFEGTDIIYPTSGFEASDYTINANATPGYIDTYNLNSIAFTVTKISTSEEKTATYSQFAVPVSITAEKSWHLDTTEIAMFGVISILGIVALVVVAANGIRNKY